MGEQKPLEKGSKLSQSLRQKASLTFGTILANNGSLSGRPYNLSFLDIYAFLFTSVLYASLTVAINLLHTFDNNQQM